MEISDIRRRVLQTLDRTRRRAAEHREEAEQAERAFQLVLPLAVTVWKQAASALRAEGHPFAVQTPAGVLRFVPERSVDDFVELALDAVRRPPAVVVRARVTRGRRVLDHESIVSEGTDIGGLDEERFLSVLLTELEPFVER
jgi:hypothetical protein